MSSESSPIKLKSTAQWELTAPDNYTYLIQASWPLQWTSRSGHENVPVIYTLDGNSVFLTATEAAWRRASAPQFTGGGLIVSIGHNITDGFLFHRRRNLDLTPPSPPATSAAPAHGGADAFIKFIEEQVKPFVRSTILAGSTVGREALFGHSYGGLCTLYTLFTHPGLFDCFFAGSPSIWYGDSVLLDYEKRFVEKAGEGQQQQQQPTLLMFYGGLEQHPVQHRGEADDAFERRRKMAQSWAMEESANSMVQRLRNAGVMKYVVCKEYPGEDHGTVIGCGLGRAVTVFFEDWPIVGDLPF